MPTQSVIGAKTKEHPRITGVFLTELHGRLFSNLTTQGVMSEQMGDKYLSMLKVNQQIVEDSSVNRSQNFRADEE